MRIGIVRKRTRRGLTCNRYDSSRSVSNSQTCRIPRYGRLWWSQMRVAAIGFFARLRANHTQTLGRLRWTTAISYRAPCSPRQAVHGKPHRASFGICGADGVGMRTRRRCNCRHVSESGHSLDIRQSHTRMRSIADSRIIPDLLPGAAWILPCGMGCLER